MKNITFATTLLWLMVLPFILFSCEDKMQEHYETPGWLKGSAWQVLEDAGSYSIFLKGVELANLRSMMEGKSILTVIAPDDAAFSVYLKDHGYSDISEINKNELSKLIGFHLLYYSYNKDRLVNFRPEGDQITDEDKEIKAGLYYKFRTHSANSATTEIDQSTGKHVTIYHLERFIPVFSYRFFASKEIDAKSNYEYFYPKSTWTGDEGFNVSNASVKEYGVIADNGYIYTVDKVLEPLETIYTELEKRDEYSTFFELYDSYSTYDYDKTLSTDYGKNIGVDSLYLHGHGTSLPPIAMEWPVPSYQSIAKLASESYSIFAPTNVALNNFFSDFWEKGNYESLSDVDPLVMQYFINQFVSKGSIVFPEQVKKGAVKNMYGIPFNFNPDKVKDRVMCVNGNFYGMDSYDTPPLFASVIGPAFRNKNSICFLYALEGSSLLSSYISKEVEFTMLIPTDEQWNATGYFLNSYITGNSLQMQSESGWTDLGTSTLQKIVNMHTVNGGEELKTSGVKVYPTLVPFNYLFVKDGKITSNALFNKSIEPDYIGSPFVDFKKIDNNGKAWTNGKTYTYDNTECIYENEASDGLSHALAVCNDQRYPYSAFAQLLKKANLVVPDLGFIRGLSSHFICFIPTNEAIKNALAGNLIPGITNGKIGEDGTLTAKTIDAVKLQNYVFSYFVRSLENVITTYPYVGSTMKNSTYITANNQRLKYTDSGSILSVQLGESKVVNVISKYDYFPFAYSDGCFHLIESIL